MPKTFGGFFGWHVHYSFFRVEGALVSLLESCELCVSHSERLADKR